MAQLEVIEVYLAGNIFHEVGTILDVTEDEMKFFLKDAPGCFKVVEKNKMIGQAPVIKQQGFEPREEFNLSYPDPNDYTIQELQELDFVSQEELEWMLQREIETRNRAGAISFLEERLSEYEQS